MPSHQPWRDDIDSTPFWYTAYMKESDDGPISGGEASWDETAHSNAEATVETEGVWMLHVAKNRLVRY